MRKELRFGIPETFEYRNMAIRKGFVEVLLKHTNLNTAMSNGIDLSQINLTVRLTQGGVTDTSTFHLLPVALASATRTGLLGNLIGAYQKGEVVTNHSAAAYATRMIRIPFLKDVILKGSDELIINVNVPALAQVCAADALGTTMAIVTENGIASQENQPKIELYNINNDRASFQQALGDDVTGIYFLNSEKDFQLSNAPFSSVMIESNAFTENKMINDIIGDEISKLATADRLTKGQNYCLYKGVPIDDVTITLPLNIANVTNSKNWILVERGVWNTEVAGRELLRQNRRYKKLNVKLGVHR